MKSKYLIIFFQLLLLQTYFLQAKSIQKSKLESLIEQGKYKVALISLQVVNQPVTNEIAFLKAKLYFESGARYLALKELNEIESKKDLKNYNWERHYFLKTNIYYELTNLKEYWKTAIKYQTIISQYHKEKTIFQANYFAMMARYYAHKTQTDSSAFYAKKAIATFRSHRFDESLIDPYFIYMVYASVCRNDHMGELMPIPCMSYSDSAIRYFKKCHKYENYNLARLYDATATAYLEYAGGRKEWTKEKYYLISQSYYLKCISIYNKIAGKYHPGIPRCLLLMGLEHSYHHYYNQAYACYNQADKLMHSEGGEYSYSNLYYQESFYKWKNWLDELAYPHKKKEQLLIEANEFEKAAKSWKLLLADFNLSNTESYWDNYNLRPFGDLSYKYAQLYLQTGNKNYIESSFQNAE